MSNRAPLSAAQAERRYLLLSLLQWLPVGFAIPVTVLLITARGIDLPVIGALFALYGAIVVLLELPTGSLADVIGRRNTLLISRSLSVVQLVGMAIAADVPAFVAVLVVSAVARALQSGPLEAWYVDTVHAADPSADVRRGISRGWALEAVGIAAGAVIGGLLPGAFNWLPADGLVISFSVPYLVAGALTGLGVVALALVVEPPRATPRPTFRQVVRDVPATVATGARLAAADRSIRLVIGATMAFGFTIAALEIVAPVQFAALLGGEHEAAGAYGVLVTLAFVGTAAGSAGAPWLANLLRSGPRAASLVSGLVAVALVGFALGPPFALAAVVYVAIYLFAGVAGPLNSETIHRRVSSGQRATMLSVVSLAQQLGGMAGSLVVPTLAAVAFGVGWAAAAIVVLAGALLLALLPRVVPLAAGASPAAEVPAPDATAGAVKPQADAVGGPAVPR